MTNEEKERLIAAALETEEGRAALATPHGGGSASYRRPMFAAALKSVGKDNV